MAAGQKDRIEITSADLLVKHACDLQGGASLVPFGMTVRILHATRIKRRGAAFGADHLDAITRRLEQRVGYGELFQPEPGCLSIEKSIGTRDHYQDVLAHGLISGRID